MREKQKTSPSFTRSLFCIYCEGLAVCSLLCVLPLLYSGLPSTFYILHLLFPCNLPNAPPQHIPGFCVDLPWVGMALHYGILSGSLWDQLHFIVSQSFLCIHLWDFMQYSQNFFFPVLKSCQSYAKYPGRCCLVRGILLSSFGDDIYSCQLLLFLPTLRERFSSFRWEMVSCNPR